MTLSPDQDRTHESIINGELARFLRERCGLDAVAETPSIPIWFPTGPSPCCLSSRPLSLRAIA